MPSNTILIVFRIFTKLTSAILSGIIFDDTLIFMIRIVIHTKFFEGRYKCELPMASVSFSIHACTFKSFVTGIFGLFVQKVTDRLLLKQKFCYKTVGQKSPPHF